MAGSRPKCHDDVISMEDSLEARFYRQQEQQQEQLLQQQQQQQ